MFKIVLSAALGFAMTVSAIAHAPLKATIPANGATMAVNPDMVRLEFAKPARVTKVMLKHTVDGAIHEEKLKLPSKKFGKELTLRPNFLGKGTYEIEWRALGKDGHVLKGKFNFTVTGE